MTRLTQSDIIRAQEARIDSLTAVVEAFLKVELERIAADERKQRNASESVKLNRGATGDHATGVTIEVVVQEGESVDEAYTRAAEAFEKAAARYPLPSGYAHPWKLDGATGDGPDTKADLEATLAAASKGQAQRGAIAAKANARSKS